MANSTVRARPAKPRPDFPLFPHRNGRWAKKVQGKFSYFGKWADDSKGEAALNLWLDQKDDLLAGRTPRVAKDGLTVRELCNRFLTAKEQQRDAGDITPRSFTDYFATCKRLVDSFGANRLVDDLAADDFEALRAGLAKQYGVHRLGNEVQRTRVVCKYALDAGLIDKPIRFGPTFKKPATRIMRAHRQQNGKRMFEAAEIRTLLDDADQPLKAMILLGINCGFGNHDCGTLPKSALDLKAGWVNFPRPKTAIERRCPLWPETVRAIREALTRRPKAKSQEHDRLVFITKYGLPWAKDTSTNPVTQEFRKLVDAVDAAAANDAKKRRVKAPAKLYRPGVAFYALRHVFETIASESRDQVAVNHLMGHANNTMAERYREWISDERLHDVVNIVRRWLFPRNRAK
ncbi:MAG: site-specific integrase [Pirellulales bacterium]